MEQITLNFILTLIKSHGPVYGPMIAIFVYLLWDRVINPHLKKKKGTFVTWKSLERKLDEENDRIKNVEHLINTQIERWSEIERHLFALGKNHTSLENKVDEFSYFIRDISTSLKTSNRLSGENKDALLQLTEVIEKMQGGK